MIHKYIKTHASKLSQAEALMTLKMLESKTLFKGSSRRCHNRKIIMNYYNHLRKFPKKNETLVALADKAYGYKD